MSRDPRAGEQETRADGLRGWLSAHAFGVLTALVACTPLVRFRADAARGLDYLIYKYLVDDAFYYFHISRHIPEFNEGISNTGFHPLYVFLIAPFHRTLAPESAVEASLWVLALACSLGSIFLYLLLSRMWTKPLAFSCAAAWAVSGRLYSLAMMGLETVLAATCVLAFFAYLAVLWSRENREPNARNLAGLGLLAGFAFLARMDSPLILAPAVAYVVVRLIAKRRVRQAAVLVVATITLPLAWMAYIYAVTGDVFPTSTTAIMAQVVSRERGESQAWRMAQGIFHGIRFYFGFGFRLKGQMWYLVATAAVGAWALRRSKHVGDFGGAMRFSILLITGFVGWGAYYALIQGEFRPWYWAHLAVLAYGVIMPLGLAVIYRWLPRAPAVVLGAALAIWLVLGTSTKKPAGPQAYDKYRSALSANDILREAKVTQRIGAFNTGIFNYFMEADVLNLDGVVNPDAVEAIRLDQLPRYIEENDIGFLIEHARAGNLYRISKDDRFELKSWINLSSKYPPFGDLKRPTMHTFLWKVRVLRLEREGEAIYDGVREATGERGD